MELKVWSKTLLNIYGCLGKLTNAIDKLVLEFGINSGNNYGFNSAFYDAQKIIELTDRKVTLINLKVLISKSLTSMDETLCRILVLKFMDKMSVETILKVLNLKRRTFYRKFNSALSSFANLLIINGFNKDCISHFIGNETWIYDVYDEIMSKELNVKNEEEISKISILSRAVRDYSIIRKNKFML